MRNSIVLTAVLCSVFVSGTVFAGSAERSASRARSGPSFTEGEDMGVVTAIDAKSRSITLADGNTYVLPGYFKVDTLATGDRVAVAYDLTIDGHIADVRSVNVL
jgi:hypothetical protein